jgi:hypothetical protein
MNKGIVHLGIIASVAWILVGGMWLLNTRSNEIQRAVNFYYDNCQKRSSSEACLKMSEDSRAGFERVHPMSDTIGEVLIPLAAAWLAAYILMWIGRWALAGLSGPIGPSSPS